MTNLEVILSVSNIVIAILLGLLLKAYLPEYAKAKAKNLATKEDISDITAKVEKVRAAITQESSLLEKRREVYERITDTLRIFISGHEASATQKEEFHAAYASCWLWAPDALIQKLNDFLKLQIDMARDTTSHSQEELKEAFGVVIIEMRKDVGFASTKQSVNGFLFMQF